MRILASWLFVCWFWKYLNQVPDDNCGDIESLAGPKLFFQLELLVETMLRPTTDEIIHISYIV